MSAGTGTRVSRYGHVCQPVWARVSAGTGTCVSQGDLVGHLVWALVHNLVYVALVWSLYAAHHVLYLSPATCSATWTTCMSSGAAASTAARHAIMSGHTLRGRGRRAE